MKFSTNIFLCLALLLALSVLNVCAELKHIKHVDIEPKKRNIVNIVLLGATGNLAEKYLWQSLFNIQRDVVGVDTDLRIYPAASSDEDSALPKLTKIYKHNITLESGSKKEKEALFYFLADNVADYQQLRSLNHYETLNKRITDDMKDCNCVEVSRIFYLSVPPRFFSSIATNLEKANLVDESLTQVIVEKPFGKDLSSAQDLAAILYQHLPEKSIKLVDHYMGKEGLSALRDFRLNNKYPSKVKSVEVSMFEKETIQGRSWFYDGVGVLRDTMQNHLMMMLALFGADLKSEGELKGRLMFFKALEKTNKQSIKYFGQYEGYKTHLAEDDISKRQIEKSLTPTYTTLQLAVLRNGTSLETDTIITLNSGKALNQRTSYIKAEFEDGSLFVLNLQGKNSFIDGAGLYILSNEGWKVNIPETWQYENKVLSSGKVEQVFRFSDGKSRLIGAYEQLLRAAIYRNSAYFVNLREVLACWKVFDGALDAAVFRKPKKYKVGSDPAYLRHTVKDEL